MINELVNNIRSFSTLKYTVRTRQILCADTYALFCRPGNIIDL